MGFTFYFLRYAIFCDNLWYLSVLFYSFKLVTNWDETDQLVVNKQLCFSISVAVCQCSRRCWVVIKQLSCVVVAALWPKKHKRKTPLQAFTRSKKIYHIGRSLKFCGMVHLVQSTWTVITDLVMAFSWINVNCFYISFGKSAVNLLMTKEIGLRRKVCYF